MNAFCARYAQRASVSSALATPRRRSESPQISLNGYTPRILVCTRHAGSPPAIVVQAGPGFPLLHEVRRFQSALDLESRFTVYYWDQRGCGPARTRGARAVSLSEQVDDLRALIRWVQARSKTPVTLVGISLGGTTSLLAAAREVDAIADVIAISPDIDTAQSDANVASFLNEQLRTADGRQLAARIAELGMPPYVDPARFQLRAEILADLRAIERRKTFKPIVAETIGRLVATYGLAGAVHALQNMTTTQRHVLPELARLNVSSELSSLSVPVRFVIGERDPLVPPAVRRRLCELSNASDVSLTVAPDAGHMVHFDRPDIVRSICGVS